MKQNTVTACKHCGKHFTVEQLLDNHEKNCIPPNFKCDICSKQFPDHVLLAKHILTHIGAMPYFCPVCKVSFISKRQLQLHSLTHEKSSHREMVNLKLLNGNLHECNRCICKFSSWPKLAFHYVCHIKEMHYTCDICNTFFFNKRNFLIHSHLHKPEGEVSCDICNETFDIKSSCLLHVITHSKFEWFRYFPSCESDENTVSSNTAVSSGSNNENLLSIIEGNSVNLSTECQDSKELNRKILDEHDNTGSQVFMKEQKPVASEYSDELHLENSNQNERDATLENSDKLGNYSQDLKTEPCETTDFNENNMNERFSSSDSNDFTLKLEHNEARVKELSVLLHRLPDCVYDAYSYNEYIKVHKLKLVKTKNCWMSSTISNETCGLADNFPHICSETTDTVSATELEGNTFHEVGEENNSYENFILKECRVVLTDIAANNVSNSVFTSLLLEESSVPVNQALNKVFKKCEVKTRRPAGVGYDATENLGISGEREVLSFYVERCSKDLVDDYVKSKPLRSETSTDNLLSGDQFRPSVCVNETEKNISVKIKELYIKVHKLSDNILNLYLNNQPIILRKGTVIGNLNMLDDCNSIVEYNSVSNASTVEKHYFESDDCNSIESNSVPNASTIEKDCLESDSSDNEKACFEPNMSTVVENKATSQHDHRIRQEGRPKRILSKQQSKVCKKKKKETIVASTSSFRNESKSKKISRKQEQKKFRKKKKLRKKRILFKKYIKSLLLNSCMDRKFLLTLKYSQLARTVKELEKRCKENVVDENYFSLVEGLINSAFLSQKNIKKKIKSSSRFTQNCHKCASKVKKNVCAENAGMPSTSSKGATTDNDSSLKNNLELSDHNNDAVNKEMTPMEICRCGYLDNKVMKSGKRKEIKNGAEVANKRVKIRMKKKVSNCTHSNKLTTVHSKLEKFSSEESQKMKKNDLKKKRNCDYTEIDSKIIKNMSNMKEIDISTSTNSKIIENVSDGEFAVHASDDENNLIPYSSNLHEVCSEAIKNGMEGKYYMSHDLAYNKRMKNQQVTSFSDFENKIGKNICNDEGLEFSNLTDSTDTLVSFTKYGKNVMHAKINDRNIINNIAKTSLKRSKCYINAKEKNISKIKVSDDTNVDNTIRKIISEPKKKKVSKAVHVTKKRKNNSLRSQNTVFNCSGGSSDKSKNIFRVKKMNCSPINNKKGRKLLSKNKNLPLMNKSKKKLSHEKTDQQLSNVSVINSVPHSDHVAFVMGKTPVNSPIKSGCETVQNFDNNQEMKCIYLPRIIGNSNFSMAQPDQNSYPGINSIQNLHSASQTKNLKVISPAAVINQNSNETASPVLVKYNAVQSLPVANVLSSPSKMNDGNLVYIDNCSRFVPALSLVENPLYSQNADTGSSVEQGKILIQNTNVQGMPIIESVGHLVILNGAKISSLVPSFNNDC